jgi:uncharacterized protein YjbI with pentapeptide repeats
MDGEAPAFSSLTSFTTGYGGFSGINFQGCTRLTGAPSFPVLTTSNGNLNFQGCTGLNGTIVFSALQAAANINFSGCTSLAGITLENCTASAGNWSGINLTNTGITTVNLSGSALSGVLDMRSLRSLETIILTGCTGTPEFKLYTTLQDLVNVVDAPVDPIITYSN